MSTPSIVSVYVRSDDRSMVDRIKRIAASRRTSLSAIIAEALADWLRKEQTKFPDTLER